MPLSPLDQFVESQINQEILDSIPEGLILADSSGSIMFLNTAAKRMHGHCFSAPVPPETGRRIFKNLDGPPLADDQLPIARALRGEKIAAEEFVLRSESSLDPIWVAATAELLANGVVVHCLDITSRRQAEAKSQDATQLAARFQTLLETAPDAIVEVDSAGKFVMLNAAVERLFGYKREELLGLPVEILIPEAMRHSHVKHRGDYMAHPGTRPMGIGMELLARRKDGTEFPVEVSLSPVPSSHGHHVTAIVRDVTERKRASEHLLALGAEFTRELEEKNRQLEQRNSEVERANRLKSEFLASMSHELRSPLHTIIGFADLLREELDGPLNTKQKRFVQNIHRDSQHLLEIINDLLDISKIEAGRLELRLEHFDAGHLAEEVLSSIRTQARAKSIKLETHFEPDSPVESDKLRFKQILYNLLSNAVKFTPDQGLITVATERIGSRLQVSVADTGIGIAASDHEAIFDKFYQVGSTTKGVREGTGLGLAITRTLVEKMGGKIWVASIPGQGSTFTFSVRLAQGSDGQNTTAKRTKPLVLLAEDGNRATGLLVNYLEPAGYEVVRAGSLSKTVQMSRELQPNVVILDLLIPGAESWRILREMKAQKDTAAIPVIVTSVLDNDDAARSLGAAAYLTKPISKRLLLDTLHGCYPEGLLQHGEPDAEKE